MRKTLLSTVKIAISVSTENTFLTDDLSQTAVKDIHFDKL